MTTGNTTLLGLALPVQGELDGTWGDVVNQQITELLDTAVAGTTTLNTDADVTLTTTVLAANQARQAVLLWTANGTTTRNITAPAQSKAYIVINASAGTQSIVVRGAGPTTGVTIIKGERALVAWNGSDFVKIGSTSGAGTFTDLTVTGNTILGDAAGDTITVNGATTFVNVSPTITPGTANGVAYLNGSKVLTTGSALTYNGTAMQINAASFPALKFGDSGATLKGEIYYGVGGNDINIVNYANGPIGFIINGSEQARLTSTGLGIGTSSPGFKLQVIGTSQLSLSAAGTQQALQLNNSDTTAGTQAVKLGFSSAGVTKASINAAVYGNDYMTFNVGSDTERMRLDSSGNLGIGTSSPSQKVDVAGTVQSQYNAAVNDATVGAYNFYNSNASAAANPIRASIVAGRENSAWGAYLDFYTSTGTSAQTSKMRLDQAGNLGLGVTPSAWGRTAFEIGVVGAAITRDTRDLVMLSNAYWASGGLTYAASAGAGRFDVGVSGFKWYTAPSGTAGNAITFTQAMTLTAAGDLGIGTSSPSEKLQVNGTAALFNNTAGTFDLKLYQTNRYDGRITVNSSGMEISQRQALPLLFLTSDTERARITSGGDLLLNTTSSRTGVNSISIEPSGNNYIEFRKSGSGSATQIQFNRNTDTTPTSAGSIATTGTTTTYNTSSDYRLKDVTGALTGYKERLMSLQPKQGTWKVDGSEFRGFLAHEFANPYRASVTGEKDAVDESGNPIYQGMQASSSEVMADLVAMVNELITENASLKARLDAANL